MQIWIDQALYIFSGRRQSLPLSAAWTFFPRNTLSLTKNKDVLLSHASKLLAKGESDICSQSRGGGDGGGQAQQTQSISRKEQPLMSGNLSKFHLRLQWSAGNQSSQSKPLPHSMRCSLSQRNFCFHLCRWFLSLRMCSSCGPFNLRLFKKMDNFVPFCLLHVYFQKMEISTAKQPAVLQAPPPSCDFWRRSNCII